MITKGNLKKLLSILEYTEVSPHRFKKEFTDVNCSIEVDFISEKIIYPQDRGLKSMMIQRATLHIQKILLFLNA